MWNYKNFPTPDELYHYGIKGQKWGERKYQYEDGSLTPAGKERYSDSSSRPSGRQKNVTGTGKSIFKKGSGLGENKKIPQSAIDTMNAAFEKEQKGDAKKYPHISSTDYMKLAKQAMTDDNGNMSFYYRSPLDGSEYELVESYPGAYEDFLKRKEDLLEEAEKKATEPVQVYEKEDFRLNNRGRKKHFEVDDAQRAEQPKIKTGKPIEKKGEGLNNLEETKRKRAKLDQAYKEAQNQKVSDINASSTGVGQKIENVLSSIKDAAVSSVSQISSFVSGLKDDIFGEVVTINVVDTTGSFLSDRRKK